jgi:hypothetical protein
MSMMNRDPSEAPMEDQVLWVDEAMAELSLLLPGWQAAALEQLAISWGLTLGELIRQLIRNCLATQGVFEVWTSWHRLNP